MQDKPNARVDEEFVDHAWEDMRRQLDTVMPEGRRRRGAWWLWFGLALLFLSGGIFWMLRTSVQELPNQPLVKQDQPVVTADPKASNRTTVVATPEAKQENTQAAASTGQLRTAQKQSATEVKPTHQDTRTSTRYEASNPVTIDPEALTLNSENKERLSSKLAEEEGQQTVDQTSDNPPANSVASSPRSLLQIDQLAVLDLKKYLVYTADQDLSVEEIAIRPPIKGSWEAYLGVLSHQNVAMEGFNAGLNFIYPLAGQRWTLRAGLGYRFDRLPLGQLVANQDQANADSQSPTVSGGNTTYVLSDVNDLFNGELAASFAQEAISNPDQPLDLVLKTHYLELPLLVSYRPHPKWSFTAGARASYLVDAYWDHRQVSFLEFSNQTSVNFTRNASTGSGWFKSEASNRADKSVTSRLDVAMVGGLTYFPHQKIGLGVRYNYGVMNILESKELQLYNRNINLQFSYLFGGRP